MLTSQRNPCTLVKAEPLRRFSIFADAQERASLWCIIAPDNRTCTFSSQLLYVKLHLHYRAIKKDPFGGCRKGTGVSSQLLVGPLWQWATFLSKKMIPPAI